MEDERWLAFALLVPTAVLLGLFIAYPFVEGVLLVIAAVRADPETAGGLDGAVDAMLALPLGPALAWVVGLGFIAYGVFTIARARFAWM